MLGGCAAAAAGDDDFFTHLHAEKAMANVTVSPGRAGPVDITIQLETMEETPLTANAVSVTLSDAKAGKRLRTVQAQLAADAGLVDVPGGRARYPSTVLMCAVPAQVAGVEAVAQMVAEEVERHHRQENKDARN